jgi:hypothetical protein
MKVMIEVISPAMGALERAIRILKGEEPFPLTQDETVNNLELLVTQIRRVGNEWSDPTLETIIGVSTLSELSLQKQLIFDPHTKVSLQKPGAYLTFPQQQSVMHSFSIDKNHTGYLVMSLKAWEALGNQYGHSMHY